MSPTDGQNLNGAQTSADEGAPPVGLSQAQAEALLAAGRGNAALKKSTRSVGRILFDNVFTLFNLINAVLGVVVLIVSLHDAQYFRNLLFMGVVVANTGISAFQELRAKWTIDRLSILTEPRAEVRRDGLERVIPIEQLVPGDILKIKAGQQIAIDGEVLLSDGLEVDESLLTGEANAVRKQPGQAVLSGSVAMAGQGYIRVDKVSKDTFAARITLEAKAEKKAVSALMRSLNKILKYVSAVLFPLGVLLLLKIYMRRSGPLFLRGTVSTVGLLISMLPEGLILLTSIALAVSVVRLGQKKALVQNMPSIETLARVDVLCLDKTGTITSGNMNLLGLVCLENEPDCPAHSLVLYGDSSEALALVGTLPQYARQAATPERLQAALGAFCAVFPEGNATQAALSAVFGARQAPSGASPWRRSAHMAFSSQRKWSAVSFEGQGSWYVGAAEKLLAADQNTALAETVRRVAQCGYRVLVLAHSPGTMSEALMDSGATLPDLRAQALLVIADEIRPDVAQTFAYFTEQGVALKIISGDHPYTLEAIARRAGVADCERIVDLSRYPDDAELAEIAADHQLFGRVSPFQKRALLKALQAQGHIVAMTGDGVNDVLALKDADCGVAMASGSEAARAAADIILLDNRMSLMVDAVYEGRRVINNIQRVASLFLIKTIYACLFALSMLPLPITFPILPIQGTLINSITVGIPSFVLALKPNKERVCGTFLANVMPLAWPAGLAAALMLILLQFGQGLLGLSAPELSTYAMFVLIAISLRALFAACLPFDAIKIALFATCVTVPIVVTLFFSRLLLLALPHGNEWWLFLPLLLFSLGLTEALYRLSRSLALRSLLRKYLGQSREDILREEQDKIRLAQRKSSARSVGHRNAGQLRRAKKAQKKKRWRRW